jgi:hypothetical protein
MKICRCYVGEVFFLYGWKWREEAQDEEDESWLDISNVHGTKREGNQPPVDMNENRIISLVRLQLSFRRSQLVSKKVKGELQRSKPGLR